MKKYILMFVSSLMLLSCVDTIILPDDKTVDEDYWKTKEQVASMVNAAYAAMADNAVIERLIVWGDFRTDELLGPSGSVDNSTTKTALDEISAVNMQTTNMFGQWSAFYNVINRCNIVLERAEAVQQVDPNYEVGDYQVDRSQMLALRALCYFYLVRNFRDVPYITEAYMNSSQNMQVPQSAPAVVLQHCIDDLEEAVKTSKKSNGLSVSDWTRVGYMTEDAINSLLADIYLWRASVMHSRADYQTCIDYCDKVIASKKAQHVRGFSEVTEKEFPLYCDANVLYTRLFVEQNAEESIFEIQSRSNLPVCQYFYKYKSATNNGGEGWLRATKFFGSASSTYNTTTSLSGTTLYSDKDLRYYAACYIPSTGDETFSVRKMISENYVTDMTLVKNRESYNYGGLNRNYSIYRVPDLMLMKAEALVQLVDTTQSDSVKEALLRVPFTLIQAVNTRSIYQDNQTDSMKWNGSTNATRFRLLNKDSYEQLVMQERLREFCFEGRRWYDLVRYNYRHIDGVDYNHTMAEIIDGGGALPKNSSDMLSLMTRQRGAEADGVKNKMLNEAYLYMPVPNSDIVICPLLRQNPAYKDTNEYEKTY